MTGRARRGFTFIELLTVFIVMSILASIAVLRYIDVKRAGVAARIVGDFNAIRVAAYNAWAEQGELPPDAPAGTVSDALRKQLPQGFTFKNTQYNYTLDWDNFMPPGGGGSGGSGGSGSGYLVGVTFSTTDAALMRKVVQTLGNKLPFFVAGGSLTYVLVGPDGLE
ncbi:MAG: type II secretion system protein [Gemmatimonadota bacterium]